MEENQNKREMTEELVEILDSFLFKTLSEPVRVQLMKYILLNGRSDIATITEHMPQDRSVVSRHLNLMYKAGILTCEKENRHIYYAIDGLAFLDKMKTIVEKLKGCMAVCCPECCKKE